MKRAVGQVTPVILAGLLGAVVLAPDALATDLRLSVTDTLVLEYRGDNSNQFTDDDDYGLILNRLNLVASAGDLTASHRLDFVWFINPPTGDFVNDIRPERMQLAYRPGDFVITAGDFYRQLGSGIVLSLRKVDELGLDVVLRGGEVKYQGDAIDAAVFGGVTNAVNLDTVNNHHIEDKEDAMAGAVVNISATDFLSVGTFGLFHQPEEELVDGERDWSVAAGVTSEIQLLDGDLVFSVEGDVQYRLLGGDAQLGWATYLKADWSFGDVNTLVELLFIDQFEQKGSTNTALGNRFDYGTAPTLERIDQEVLDQRDVAGGRVRVEGTLMDGDLTIYGNLMVRFNKAFEDSRLRQIHFYTGGVFLWDYGASRLAASAGYRDEEQLGRKVKTMGHFDVDLHYSFNDDWALHATSTNEFRTLSTIGYERGSLFAGVDWSGVGSLTFEFGYDTQNKSPGARNYFFAGIVSWHVTDRMQLRATAGTQRGGLKCVAGVCRIFPEFTGATLEAVARF